MLSLLKACHCEFVLKYGGEGEEI